MSPGLARRRSERIKSIVEQNNTSGTSNEIIRTVSRSEVQPDEVKSDDEINLLLTQPFHGDSSDSDNDDCLQAEDAFLKKQYIPKTLLRDRDIGDPPLEMVLETHRKRVLRGRAGKMSSQPGSVVAREQATKKRNNIPNKRKKQQGGDGRQEKKAARVSGSGSTAKGSKPTEKRGGYRFVVDLESGLEDDSSDDEIEQIAREVRVTYRCIKGILNRRSW